MTKALLPASDDGQPKAMDTLRPARNGRDTTNPVGRFAATTEAIAIKNRKKSSGRVGDADGFGIVLVAGWDACPADKTTSSKTENTTEITMRNRFAALAFAFTLAAIAPTTSACNPKDDPSCNREVPGLAGPLACALKFDSSCDN